MRSFVVCATQDDDVTAAGALIVAIGMTGTILFSVTVFEEHAK